MRHSRRLPGFWAAMGHRLSGVALAIFLPIHFLTLGLAIEGEAQLDGALAWFDQPLFKIGEWGLVMALTLHLGFGLRVLALEFLPWRDTRKGLIGVGAAAAVLVGALFLINLG